MKDTAPKGLGIFAVAALFGIIALMVAWLVLHFGGFASILIGAIVAIITAIILWLGWREAAPGPTGPRDLSPSADKTSAAAPSATAPTASATTASTSAAPAAALAATGVGAAAAATAASKGGKASKASAKPAAKTAKAAKPAAKAAKPAAKAAKPAAKATKPAAKAAKPAAKAAKPAAKATKSTKSTKSTASKATPAAAAADDGPIMTGKPETLTAARGGKADDLKQIKGVGPQLEGVLNGLGFWHFDQVAAWGGDEIAWVDSRLKFKGRIVRDDWVSQAKTLAAGGTTEFSKKVDKGGVY